MKEEQPDTIDPKERESLRGIVRTEIQMVRKNRWLSPAEKEAKINQLHKIIIK